MRPNKRYVMTLTGEAVSVEWKRRMFDYPWFLVLDSFNDSICLKPLAATGDVSGVGWFWVELAEIKSIEKLEC